MGAFTSVSYFTAAGQNAFTTETAMGLPIWDNPFPEQSAKLKFRLKYNIAASSWVAMTLNTLFDYPGTTTLYVPSATISGGGTYYLCGEDNFQEKRGGLLEWERTWARIPADRYEPMVYPYQFPAIMGGSGSFTVGAYTAISYAASIGGSKMFISYSGPAIGQQVVLSYTKPGGGSGLSGIAVNVFQYASNGIIVDVNSDFVASTYSKAVASVTAGSSDARISPWPLPARAVVSYGYFLATPGTSAFVITPTRKQRWLLAGIQEVDYVSPQTIPTAASYLALVSGISWFVAEDETVNRWMGNIMERKVIYVYAQ